MSPPDTTLRYCSFCAKSEHEVRKLIAGPEAMICDACLEICTRIIQDGDVLIEKQERENRERRMAELLERIHRASHLREVMLELPVHICEALNADRMSIYRTSQDGTHLLSQVMADMNQTRDLKLPITEKSFAGFCAFHKRVLNISDVYNDAELRAHGSQLRFIDEVDKRTGYRTRQMLLAPILNIPDDALLGVLHWVNTKSGNPFSGLDEKHAQRIAHALAPQLQRLQADA